MYKKLKMTHPDSQQFTILKANLNTYNNILKRSIWLQKKLYYCLQKIQKWHAKNMENNKWSSLQNKKKQNLPRFLQRWKWTNNRQIRNSK